MENNSKLTLWKATVYVILVCKNYYYLYLDRDNDCKANENGKWIRKRKHSKTQSDVRLNGTPPNLQTHNGKCNKKTIILATILREYLSFFIQKAKSRQIYIIIYLYKQIVRIYYANFTLTIDEKIVLLLLLLFVSVFLLHFDFSCCFLFLSVLP